MAHSDKKVSPILPPRLEIKSPPAAPATPTPPPAGPDDLPSTANDSVSEAGSASTRVPQASFATTIQQSPLLTDWLSDINDIWPLAVTPTLDYDFGFDIHPDIELRRIELLFCLPWLQLQGILPEQGEHTPPVH